MIDIGAWMNAFLHALQKTFADRICFVGLQGSYARGEAGEASDIDVVVILDEFSADDIQTYGCMLDNLPSRNLVCGFISGQSEIMNWDAADLFQFYYDTTPIVGNLDDLLVRIDESAVQRAVKVGACNIYHACVHNMLHERSMDLLQGLYKSAIFTIQAICFLQNRTYVRHRKDLLKIASESDQTIIKACLSLKTADNKDFNKYSEILFQWSGKLITAY